MEEERRYCVEMVARRRNNENENEKKRGKRGRPPIWVPCAAQVSNMCCYANTLTSFSRADSIRSALFLKSTKLGNARRSFSWMFSFSQINSNCFRQFSFLCNHLSFRCLNIGISATQRIGNRSPSERNDENRRTTRTSKHVVQKTKWARKINAHSWSSIQLAVWAQQRSLQFRQKCRYFFKILWSKLRKLTHRSKLIYRKMEMYRLPVLRFFFNWCGKPPAFTWRRKMETQRKQRNVFGVRAHLPTNRDPQQRSQLDLSSAVSNSQHTLMEGEE